MDIEKVQTLIPLKSLVKQYIFFSSKGKNYIFRSFPPKLVHPQKIHIEPENDGTGKMNFPLPGVYCILRFHGTLPGCRIFFRTISKDKYIILGCPRKLVNG